MKYNKGFAPLMILAIVIGALVIGGGAYYLGKSGSKQEVKVGENNLPNNPEINQNQNLPVNNNQQVNTPSITVFSPNGGETYKAGDKITVKWTSKGLQKDTPVQILLITKTGPWNSSPSSNFDLSNDNSILVSSGSATFTLPELNSTKWTGSKDIRSGNYYKVYISQSLSDTIDASDYSDNTFSINSIITDNNLIKQTGCGVSFSKASSWSVISNTNNETILDISSTDHIIGTSGINIKCVLGNSITNTDAKFGNITYYYDSSSQKWMVSKPNERDGGTLPAVVATPEFTVNGYPVFRGTGRWLTYIIPISPSSILSLNEGDTEGGYTQTLTNLVKTLKKL